MNMPPPSTLDSDLLLRLRAAMRDPIEREIIQREMEDAAQDNTWGGALSKLGGQVEKMQSPGAAAAAGIGGMLGLGLKALLKKKAPGGSTTSSSDTSTSSYTPGGGGGGGVEQNLTRPAGSWSDATPVPAAEAWKNTPQPPSVTPPATPTPPPAPVSDATSTPAVTGRSRLMMGLDGRGNNVSSLDGGRTWTTDAGTPVSGPIYQQTEIGGGMRRGGRVRKFAGGGDLPAEPPPEPKKAVLMRRPIPVIHTTIVIAHKPTKKEDKKPVKKARGGPLKPAALPPKKGPESQGPPSPFKKGGHVQVPRGSGIAQRGKTFRGIY
jgi:hypothetical protein